jgi:signal transduction histidine kinase
VLKIIQNLKLKLFVTVLFTVNCVQNYAQSIDSLYKVAGLFFERGNYAQVLKINLDALKLCEKNKNCKLITKAYYKTASAYYHLKLVNKTKEYLLNANYQAQKCNNDTLRATTLRLLGSLYCEELKVDSALVYLNEAESILEKLNLSKELGMLQCILGETFLTSRNGSEKAQQYFKNALQNAFISSDNNLKGFAYLKLGRYKNSVGKYQEAEAYFQSSLNAYAQINLIEGKLYALHELANTHYKSGDSKQAFQIMQKIEKIKDSIFKKETAAQTAKFEVEFETQKKANEIKIKSLELEKQKQITKNKTLILFSIIVFLIMLIVLLMVYLRNRQKYLLLEAKEKERNRISRDIHDHLGSHVSFIISNSGQLLNDTENPKIKDINSAAKNIMRSLRETIWLINKPKVYNTELADKIKEHLQKFLLIDYEVQDKIKDEYIMNGEKSITVFRAIQEIINNINKHSKATFVQITFSSSEEFIFSIKISDNGIGFTSPPNSHQNGLKNIESRMKEIKAHYFYTSTLGEGSSFTIQVK